MTLCRHYFGNTCFDLISFNFYLKSRIFDKTFQICDLKIFKYAKKQEKKHAMIT